MAAPPYRTVALIGPPCSGKSTLSLGLREVFPRSRSFAVRLLLEHLRTIGHPIAEAVDAAPKTSPLIPDENVEQMLQWFLETVQPPDLVLLEGFPIKVSQSRIAKRHLAKCGRRVEAILSLEANAEVLRSRARARRVCPACEAEARAGVPVPAGSESCPRCGGALAKRPDDADAMLERRIELNLRQKALMIAEFEGARVVELDTVALDAGAVLARAREALGVER